MEREIVLREATFTTRLDTYYVLGGALSMALSCIGLIAVPVWLVAGPIMAVRIRKAMSATLTNRSLKVKRGVWVKVDKTIPLDKITDLGMTQGPIMRLFGLHGLTIETAGQSAGPGALVTLLGIEDTVAFRDAVLEQRDKVIYDKQAPGSAAAPGMIPPSGVLSGGDDTLLRDIRDTLHRIESHLANKCDA